MSHAIMNAKRKIRPGKGKKCATHSARSAKAKKNPRKLSGIRKVGGGRKRLARKAVDSEKLAADVSQKGLEEKASDKKASVDEIGAEKKEERGTPPPLPTPIATFTI